MLIMNWSKFMNKLKMSFGITVLLVILMSLSCPQYNAIGIPVKNVYYVGKFNFVNNVSAYIVCIDFDENVLPKGVADWKIDWATICNAENNEVTGGGQKYPFGNFSYTFDIRLKNLYDPTTDVGKKIYFNNKVLI